MLRIYYDGNELVKREVINGIVTEIYVKYNEGIIYLRKYVNYEFDSQTCIADLNKGGYDI